MHTIGILGGTFNPIHFGHLRMAQELAESLSLNEVRFIPSANPPHKPAPQVSADHRAAMVQLAIANNPLFSLDNRELLRVGNSYTYDTLRSLRDELGMQTSITLMMGNDAFTKLNTWHRWDELLSLCHICLVARPQLPNQPKIGLPKTLESYLQAHYTELGDDLAKNAFGLITMQHITALDISSTAIREAVKNQHSVRYLLPDDVLSYMQAHQLY
ncbi:MAG TPA: nicotinate-nucleotide adenylyltransferase [Methylotenera sp.]|nr:nicotinate-nucleotide adenylyltransferase [Methylotenera sp.]HPH05995.1 nicotinate-nucleotide adenylyltransferase [Methylotenera sp.]HPN00573.1 nicotinate-nucleotide adenylyltransferase [Methylotenera sp.]